MGSQAHGSQPSPLAIFQWFSMHSSQCSPCTFGRQLHRPETRSHANLEEIGELHYVLPVGICPKRVAFALMTLTVDCITKESGLAVLAVVTL